MTRGAQSPTRGTGIAGPVLWIRRTHIVLSGSRSGRRGLPLVNTQRLDSGRFDRVRGRVRPGVLMIPVSAHGERLDCSRTSKSTMYIINQREMGSGL